MKRYIAPCGAIICLGLAMLSGGAAGQPVFPVVIGHASAATEIRQAPDLSAVLSIEDGEKRKAALQNAIDYYEHHIATHPEDVAALQKLGKLYSWTNKLDLAIITYLAAIRLEDGNLSLKTDLARIYRWAKRLPEAEAQYGSVISVDPVNHQALKGLASTYLKMGEYSSAQEVFDRALALYPDDAELHKEQGVLFAWQEHFGDAITELKRAIELSPDMADAYTTLGDVHFWNKQFSMALEQYKLALTRSPDSFDLQIAMAKTYQELRNLDLAEEYATAALRLNPVSPDARKIADDIAKERSLVHWEDGLHYLEFFAMLFVIALIGYGYAKNRQMLRRRHKVAHYFIPVILPIVAALSVAAFVVETQMKSIFEVEDFESVAAALALILLGFVYLFQLCYTGRSGRRSDHRSVLVIGAHPDDIELGCGGYILKAKAEGSAVYGVTLTKGERGTDKTSVRETEARDAARFMELDGYWMFDFADTHLQDNVRDVKESIEGIVKHVQPDLVLMHNQYDQHADHRATFVAAKEAARQVPVVLSYETVSTPNEFKPDYYVDITDYLNDMLTAVAYHHSQRNKPYMDPELLKGRAAHRGIQSGVPYAHAFQVVRIVD